MSQRSRQAGKPSVENYADGSPLHGYALSGRELAPELSDLTSARDVAEARRILRDSCQSTTILDAREHTRLIDIDRMMRKTSRSRSTIYRWEDMGILPPRAKKPEGTISALWWEDEVDAALGKMRNAPAHERTLSVVARRAQSGASTRQVVVRTATEQPVQPRAQLVKGDPKTQPKKDDPRSIHATLERSSLGGSEVYLDRATGRIYALIGQVQMLDVSALTETAQQAWQIDDVEGRVWRPHRSCAQMPVSSSLGCR